MQISYNWLMDIFPENIDINKLSQILTDIGLEVEAIEKVEKVKGNLEGVVIGEVMDCQQHPDADRLKVTRVDVGGDRVLQIVCGAPNVAVGQRVLVAMVDATIYNMEQTPLTIKRAKIRGVESEGMLCADDELGLGDSHDGIRVLSDDAPVGTPATSYFDLGNTDYTIHIGLTPNRSDAMSHIGIAKDVAAYIHHHEGRLWDIPNKYMEIGLDYPTALSIPIEIIDTDRCPRYAGVVIQNVTVSPSPAWIRDRLIAVGLRPINNIVDITNLVLKELGQPLHAFDLDSIKDGIQVKTVPAGTPFTTLDGKERTLTGDDLMITDAVQPLCIAGVMGGSNSGVTEDTKDIFIESAYFHPKSIRNTSMQHGLRSDAALRFEKQVDVDMVLPALYMAIHLILEMCPDATVGKVSDVYPVPIERDEVTFSYQKISQLCGKDYSIQEINNILDDLGFTMVQHDEISATVLVPHAKNDISQMADIAEEIIRIDGLNNIPTGHTIRYTPSQTASTASRDRRYKQRIADWLAANGLSEIVTNSIVDKAAFSHRSDVVTMINSLSSELNAMRPEMVLSGLEVIKYNQNRKNGDLAIYEFGNVYSKSDEGYNQNEKLSIWTTGDRLNKQWMTDAIAYDLYYLKGLMDRLFNYAGVGHLQTQVDDTTYQYRYRNDILCTITKVPKRWCEIADVRQGVYYAEVAVSLLMTAIAQQKTVYQEVNKYPNVSRDLALVLDKKYTYHDIERATRKAKVTNLQSYQLFDIYEGKNIGEDKRSWAINYHFENRERTFAEDEIDEIMKKLMKVYAAEIGADIRK